MDTLHPVSDTTNTSNVNDKEERKEEDNANSEVVVKAFPFDYFSPKFKETFSIYWKMYMTKFFKNYLFTYRFIADLILFIFIDWIFVNVPAVRIGKFLASTIRFNSQYESLLSMLSFRSSTVSLVRLLLMLLFLFHLFACIFFFVSDAPGDRYATGYIAIEPLKTSLLRNACMSRNVDYEYGSQRWRQYACALYFSIINIVGFQKISAPQGLLQTVYAVAYAIAGSLLFATIVGTVSALISTRDLTAAMYQEKIENVRGFMRHRRISPWLKKTVTRYYSIIRQTRRDISVQEVFHDLDTDLFKNITQRMYKDRLLDVKVFKDVDNDFLIGDICSCLGYVLVLSGIDIIHESDVGENMYIINNGEIEVYSEDEKGNETIFATVGPGSLIGDSALVNTDEKRCASCRASTPTVELITLSYQNFYQCLEKYPDYKEQVYQFFRDRRVQFMRENNVTRLNKAHDSRNEKSLFNMLHATSYPRRSSLTVNSPTQEVKQAARRRANSYTSPTHTGNTHPILGKRRGVNLTIQVPNQGDEEENEEAVESNTPKKHASESNPQSNHTQASGSSSKKTSTEDRSLDERSSRTPLSSDNDSSHSSAQNQMPQDDTDDDNDDDHGDGNGGDLGGNTNNDQNGGDNIGNNSNQDTTPEQQRNSRLPNDTPSSKFDHSTNSKSISAGNVDPPSNLIDLSSPGTPSSRSPLLRGSPSSLNSSLFSPVAPSPSDSNVDDLRRRVESSTPSSMSQSSQRRYVPRDDPPKLEVSRQSMTNILDLDDLPSGSQSDSSRKSSPKQRRRKKKRRKKRKLPPVNLSRHASLQASPSPSSRSNLSFTSTRSSLSYLGDLSGKSDDEQE